MLTAARSAAISLVPQLYADGVALFCLCFVVAFAISFVISLVRRITVAACLGGGQRGALQRAACGMVEVEVRVAGTLSSLWSSCLVGRTRLMNKEI